MRVSSPCLFFDNTSWNSIAVPSPFGVANADPNRLHRSVLQTDCDQLAIFLDEVETSNVGGEADVKGRKDIVWPSSETSSPSVISSYKIDDITNSKISGTSPIHWPISPV